MKMAVVHREHPIPSHRDAALWISAASRNGFTILNKLRLCLAICCCGQKMGLLGAGPGKEEAEAATVLVAADCHSGLCVLAMAQGTCPELSPAPTVTLLHTGKQHSRPLALHTQARFFLSGLHCK